MLISMPTPCGGEGGGEGCSESGCQRGVGDGRKQGANRPLAAALPGRPAPRACNAAPPLPLPRGPPVTPQCGAPCGSTQLAALTRHPFDAPAPVQARPSKRSTTPARASHLEDAPHDHGLVAAAARHGDDGALHALHTRALGLLDLRVVARGGRGAAAGARMLGGVRWRRAVRLLAGHRPGPAAAAAAPCRAGRPRAAPRRAPSLTASGPFCRPPAVGGPETAQPGRSPSTDPRRAAKTHAAARAAAGAAGPRHGAASGTWDRAAHEPAPAAHQEADADVVANLHVRQALLGLGGLQLVDLRGRTGKGRASKTGGRGGRAVDAWCRARGGRPAGAGRPQADSVA